MKKKYIIPQTESNTTFHIESLMLMRDSGQYSTIMSTKERDVEFEQSEEHEPTYGSIW